MNLRQVEDSRSIRSAALGAVLVLLVLSLLFGDLALKRYDLRFEQPGDTGRDVLPSPSVVSALFLNYDTAAADLVWIRALVYFGERRQAQQDLDDLESYARTVSALDPYFYDVYQWFADAYVAARHAHSSDAIEVANRFLEVGMRYFPDDYRLPHTAGLNYIGYSTRASLERKIHESKRATEFLERAAKLEGAPSSVVLLLDHFHRRKRRLQRQLNEDGTAPSSEQDTLSESQRQLYARLYLLAERDNVRRQLEQMLQRYSDDEVLEQVDIYTQRLERRHSKDVNYLPPDLWTTLIDGE